METKLDKPKRKTARRGNGEGSIYQRGDGRWCASVVIGRNEMGKLVRKVVYGWTKGEVQEKLTKLMPQQQAGTLSVDRLTVGSYLNRWLENEVRTNRSASTYANYETTIRLHINPIIGGDQLSKLTPSRIKQFYSALERQGRSAKTRESVHGVLHAALEVAVKSEIVTRNAFDAVDRPKAPKPEITPLSLDQAQTFLQAIAEQRLRALYILAIDSGLRQGEMIGLRWEDIDLDAGVIQIRRKIVEVRGKLHVGEPKTASGKRSVTICPMTVDALRLHKARMMQEGRLAGGWVFVGRKGEHVRRNWLLKSFHKNLTAAGLPIVRFHDLRHTCATLLLEQNTHAKIVQERLGHSKISITLDTYSHVTQSMQQAAATTMQGILKATGS
jgi:integrase